MDEWMTHGTETEIPKTKKTIIDSYIAIVDDRLIFRGNVQHLSDITAVRYGWKPMELDMFTIGKRFILETVTHDKRLRISIQSWLGVGAKHQLQKVNALMNAIWGSTVVRLAKEMFENIHSGNEVKVGKCVITSDGIHCNAFFIAWTDLSYQANYNRLTLNSKSNPSVYTNLYYTETDNAHILRCILESFIDELSPSSGNSAETT